MRFTAPRPADPTLPEYPERPADPDYPSTTKMDWLHFPAAAVAWAGSYVLTVMALNAYKTSAAPSDLTFDDGYSLGTGLLIWQVLLGIGFYCLLSWPLRIRERRRVQAWRDARNEVFTKHNAALEAWSQERKRLIEEHYAALDVWRREEWPRAYGDPAND